MRRRLRTVHVDSGGNLGDRAPWWELSVSRDGRTWRTVVTGTGTGRLTQVEVGNVRARHLRVTSTGSAGDYGGIADIRLYR